MTKKFNLFKTFNLKNQFITIFVSMFLIGSTIIGLYGYNNAKNAYINEAIDKGKEEISFLENRMTTTLKSIPSDLSFLANFYEFKQYLNWLNVGDEENTLNSKKIVEDSFRSYLENKKLFYSLSFIDLKGNELISFVYDDKKQTVSNISSNHIQNKKNTQYFKKAIELQRGEYYVSNIELQTEGTKVLYPHLPIVRFVKPIFVGENKIGVMALNLYASSLIKSIYEFNAFNEYREYFLIDKNGNYLMHRKSNKLWGKDLQINEIFSNDYPSIYSTIKEDNKQNGVLMQENKIVTFSKINPPNNDRELYWYLVSITEEAYAMKKVENFTYTFLAVLFFTTMIIIILIYKFMDTITLPLKLATEQLKGLSIGSIDKKEIKYDHQDEIGEIINSVKLLKQNTNELVEQSKKISQGEYDHHMEIRSEDDMIIKALNEMSHSLQDNKVKENERSWIQEGINQLTHKLSGERTVTDITELTLDFIIPYIGAAMGTLYLYIQETEELYLSGTYACSDESIHSKSFRLGEGTIGQVAKTQESKLNNNINSSQMTKSTLKEHLPKGTYTLPLVHNKGLYGVMELISFYPFTQVHELFLENVKEIIATYIYSRSKNEKIKKLLSEAQISNEELLSTKKNLESEKQFTQTLMDSQEQIIITTDGTRILTSNERFNDFFAVDNIEEFVKEYSANCICDTFNKNAPEGYLQTMMGREKWIDYVISRPYNTTHKAMITIGDSDFIFSVTAAKLPGDEGLKSAVFTDITEMEKAQKELSLEEEKFRSLAEGSLDSIMRFDREYRHLYASPATTQLTGIPHELFLDKTHEEIGFPLELCKTFDDAIEVVFQTKESHRVMFDLPNGTWLDWMLVPEKDGDEVTAVVTTARDITLQKKNELEIENAKIEIEAIHKHTRDSIEYASLIQGALIPDANVFRNYFSDYFTIWEPKDIVGGDIYLFEELRDKEECLLMVIDCTGHGVPGAFVTMLVKAIERQIVAKIENDQEIDVSPAWILSYFNKTMKKLLQQESDESISNAGFDAGILYYNKKENIIKFSGAETPLFYLEDEELKTIKGNRHSIGYKKSDVTYEFKEHIIPVKEDMKFYLTTDGYLDQNGGEKNFPMGKKQFSKLLVENQDKTFKKQEELLVHSLEKYQGNEERNDDITVIGFEIKEQFSVETILKYD